MTLYDRVCVQRLHQRPGGLREREHRAPAKDVTLQAYDMVLHSKGFWIAMQTPVLYGGWHGGGVCLSL